MQEKQIRICNNPDQTPGKVSSSQRSHGTDNDASSMNTNDMFKPQLKKWKGCDWIPALTVSESYVFLPIHIYSKEIQVVYSRLKFTDKKEKCFPFNSYSKTEQKVTIFVTKFLKDDIFIISIMLLKINGVCLFKVHSFFVACFLNWVGIREESILFWKEKIKQQ